MAHPVPVRLFYIGALYFSLTALSGCATSKPLINISPGSMTAEQTILFLQTKLTSDDANLQKQGCLLFLKNRTTGETFETRVQGGDDSLFLLASPGVYQNTSMKCMQRTTWDFDSTLANEIPVKQGKINYAGKFNFHFDQGSLTLKRPDRKETLTSLQLAFKSIPMADQRQVISAYTGKSIHLKMTEVKGDAGFNFHLQQNKGEKVNVDPLYSRFRRCGEEAAKIDRSLVGHIQYVGTYEGGTLSKLDKVENNHAFPETFEPCLEESFQTFKPANQSRFVIQLTF